MHWTGILRFVIKSEMVNTFYYGSMGNLFLYLCRPHSNDINDIWSCDGVY